MRPALAMHAVSAFHNDERHGRYRMTLSFSIGLLAATMTPWLANAQQVGAGASEADPVKAFRAVVKSKDVTAFSQAALNLRKWMIANDPLRPKYHFTGPESWINDVNGPIRHEGRYHLFYQFDPMVADGKGGFSRSPRCWGHAVSDDLVHWTDWPVSLWPDTPHDRAGVFSGNTFVADDGLLCALYTGNVAGHKEAYCILARSGDGGITWKKKMVMDDSQRPNADSPVHWDGFTWKEGDKWHQLVGGTTGGANRQGAAWLWTSSDLEQWKLQKNIAPSIRFGEFWELPYLISLGGRHVLLVGCSGNPYWAGTYDKQSMTFTADAPRPRLIDNGRYYAINVNLTDDKDPAGSRRRLMQAWATIGKSRTAAVPYWEGAHAIVRVITLKDGRIWQEPIPELRVLRGRKQSVKDLRITPQSRDLLKDIKGDALEIIATFEPGDAARFGLNVRASAKDAARVCFDSGSLTFNGQTSDLKPGEPVMMHVFVDRSIVEVFINGNAHTMAAWHDAAAGGVDVFAEGGTCTLKSLEAYELASAWQ